jgi:hypothetical protein
MEARGDEFYKTAVSTNEQFPGRNTLKHRVGPGIWIDADGHTHFSIEELLAMVDLPDTPANRAKVKAILEETLGRAGLETKYRERPD